MNLQLASSLAVGAFACLSAATSAQVPTKAPSLMPYYTYYPVPGTYEAVDPPTPGFPPTIRVIGGGVDPPPIVTSTGSFASIQRMLSAPIDDNPYGVARGMHVFERRDGVCTNKSAGVVPVSPISGAQYTFFFRAEPRERNPFCGTDAISGEPLRWMTTARTAFLTPIRRTAIDGSEYDASPMLLELGGVPWMTYYAGYRLGFVAGESNWVPSNAAKVPELAGWPSFPNARDNFELVKLPPPFVEGEVVEYFNDVQGPFTGRFGYAANSEEQKVFDAAGAWIRTGQSFKSGGYVAVCSVATGAALDTSTRMYSADAKECPALAALPAFPVSGTPIRASRPIPAATPGTGVTCPTATVPLYRLFNNGFGARKGYGHRFLTSNAVRQEMIRFAYEGWTDEGVVMCVPQ